MNKIKDLIRHNFGIFPDKISKYGNGVVSKTYTFNIREKRFFIKLNSSRNDFDKDKFAFEHFSTYQVPIPETIQIGKFNSSNYFAISEKANGCVLSSCSSSIKNIVLPDFIEKLFLINQIGNSNRYYGPWNRYGNSRFLSWSGYLKNIEKNIAKSKVDKNNKLFKLLLKQLDTKIQYVPEIRNLIHGDFGFNNILTNGKKITAILDWGDSMYGDFIYDAAWQTIWAPERNFTQLFRDFYKRKKLKITNFEKRLNCYQAHICLRLLLYFKGKKDSVNYKHFEEIAEKIIQ